MPDVPPERDFAGRLTTVALTVWFVGFGLMFLLLLVVSAIGSLGYGDHSSFTFYGSPWSYSSMPWYRQGQLLIADLVLKWLTYPVGYVALFVPFLLAVSGLIRRGTNSPVWIRRVTLVLLFVVPAAAQAVIVIWLHRKA